MSFRSEINTLLKNDASINAVIDKVYYGFLPDNVQMANYYLVWIARVEEAYNEWGELDWGDKYLLTIKAVGKNPIENETLGNLVKRAIEGYSSTNLKTTYFEREVDVFDPDNDIFTLSMDFSCQYIN